MAVRGGGREGRHRRRSPAASVDAGPTRETGSPRCHVQANPGLRDAAVALRGRLEEDDKGHRQGLYYPRDQDDLGVADPLGRMSLNDLQMRFITVVKVHPKLATTYGKLITRSLGFVNHALGAHRPSGSPTTPSSLLRILPALVHSQHGRMSRTARLESAGLGDLPDYNSPMAYGVHRKARRHVSGGWHGSNGRDQVGEGPISVPVPTEDNGSSAGSSSGTARARQ